MFPLRDENPTHRTPWITLGLIGVNVLAFLLEMGQGEGVDQFIVKWGAIPVEITRGVGLFGGESISPFVTIFSSMFLHGGLGHLIGNLWFLWIFGDNVEDFLGHATYLFYYLLTGIAASMTHVLLNPESVVPAIGASGAISGVLGGYLVLHPKIRVHTLVTLGFFFRVIPIPAVFFLVIWFGMQLLGGIGGPTGIAFGAHVGGFVAGALIMFLLTKRIARPEARYEPRRINRF